MVKRKQKPTPVPVPEREVWNERWWSGPYPAGFREGMAQYTHMIRAPGDPERSERTERAGPGDTRRVCNHFHRMNVQHAKTAILAHVADGLPRTFNRIVVELWDLTADMAGDRIEQALFDLVAEHKLQHTLVAPILWLPVWDAEGPPPPLLPQPPEGATIREIQL